MTKNHNFIMRDKNKKQNDNKIDTSKKQKKNETLSKKYEMILNEASK